MRPRLRYHIPLIGPWLFRRAMRRMGRELGEAFKRGMVQAFVGADRELDGLRRTIASGQDFGLLAMLKERDADDV